MLGRDEIFELFVIIPIISLQLVSTFIIIFLLPTGYILIGQGHYPLIIKGYDHFISIKFADFDFVSS